jgi:DNA polymerase III subunit delta'
MNIFQWQSQVWSQLIDRRAALPHALLIQGRSGLGKTHLALSFAKRLLCEVAQGTEAACGSCPSCGWFEQGNHPDFRLVQPDALGTGEEGQAGRDTGETATSKQIRIEQVRDLQSFLRIGTHRGGLRVALIRPAEAMNAATANALLKSLEEPPSGTLLMLVSSSPERLLPTVRSRCQVVAIHLPEGRVAADWLKSQGVSDPDAALSFAAGAPLAAIEQLPHGPHRATLVGLLATPGFDPVRGAEQILDAAPPDVVTWLQQWIYDIVRVRFGGAPRYHSKAAEQLARAAAEADPIRLTRLARRVAEARALALHPLNPRLFFEDLLMQYRKLSGGADGG